MAIATGAAILGGAALGTAGQIYAGNQAADAQRDASRSSNALQRYIYDQNRADQAPYRDIGVQALQQLGALYGFAPTYGPEQFAQSQEYKDAMAAYNAAQPNFGGIAGNVMSRQYAQKNPFDQSQAYKDAFSAWQGSRPQASAPDFSAFTNSPDYQFAFDQGNKALEQQMAARGLNRSGSSMKAAMQFGQGLASQQFGNYTNRLANLAGIGQSATNQLGQYGQNYAANVGNNYMNAANAQASSYMNTANALTGFGRDLAYGYGRGVFNQPPPASGDLYHGQYGIG